MTRSGLAFDGIGAKYVTMKPNADIVALVTAGTEADAEGKAVTITGNGEAGLGSAGDPLFGITTKYEDSNAMTVQYAGFAEFAGVSGSLPTAGAYLVVDGNGAVMTSTGATGPAKAINVGTDAIGPVMVLIG